MRAGKLRDIVIIERGTDTINAAGTPETVWATHATLRAEVVQRGTTEFMRVQGAVDEAVVVFRTRFLAGITTADRIVFDGRVFGIREIVEIERRRGLELRCQEGAA
ncbi:phage head closure protein [Frigidibacter oleivorans]|uniref:phage head closure protein n=1 Tax=Frigidibacter oleivorans TaxID=2487129 RepID=UPI000F8E9D20|nr:phage head closure protein [Frigidibacter oleivorans]